MKAINILPKFSRLNLKKFSRTLLSVMICFQLAVYPQFALPQIKEVPKSLKKHARIAENFNKDVLSLRNKIFGDSKKIVAHPLDTFRLLDQILLQQEETEKLEEEKKPSLIKRTSHKITNYFKTPIATRLEGRDLLFEVREKPSLKNRDHAFKEGELGPIQSILSHGDRKISPNILRSELQDLYQGNSHIVQNKSKSHYFTISHRNQSLHLFRQNISWIATMGSYAVFLEKSLVFKDRALISFIDLDYFSEAIGKTNIPVFYLPFKLDSEKDRRALLSPHSIQTEEEVLKIGDFEIQKDQIWFLSRLQQLNFNLTVSLVDPTGQKLNNELIEDIVQNYTESLEKDDKFSEIKKDKNFHASYEDMKKIIEQRLQIRSQLGSIQEKKGNYGQFKHAQQKLSENKVKEISGLVKEFSKNLDKDIAFQNEMHGISKNLAHETKKTTRLLTFLTHITRPQPLGAPKIERALGLVANSVLKGESLKNRMAAFKEGLAQLFSFKIPRISMAVLAGAGLAALPGTTSYFHSALSSTNSWLQKLFEIFRVTGENSAGFIVNNAVYESYLTGDNPLFLAKGVTALIVILLTTIGLIHFSINFVELTKHLKSRTDQGHRSKVQAYYFQIKNSLKDYAKTGDWVWYEKENPTENSSVKETFISYMDQNKKDFYNSLSISEMRKIGLITDLTLPNGQSVRILLKSAASWSHLIEKFKSNQDMELELSTLNEKNVFINMILKSTNESQDTKNKNIGITLNDKNEKIYREFKISNQDSVVENLDDFMNDSLHIKDGIDFSFTGEGLHYAGLIQDANLSQSEKTLLKNSFKKIKENKRNKADKKGLFSRWRSNSKQAKKILEAGDNFSEELLESSKHAYLKDIKTLKKALLHFSFGYSSFSNTFLLFNRVWNYFFLTRNLVLRPRLGLGLIYFSGLFDRVYLKSHRATRLNGGYASRLRNATNLVSHIPIGNLKSLREDRNAVENKIIEIEKTFLDASIKQAYFDTILPAAGQNNRDGRALREGITSHSKNLGKKSLLTFEMYQRDLFKEAVRDFLKDKLELQGKTDGQIKREFIKMFREDRDLLSRLSLDSEDEIRERLVRISQEQDLLNKSHESVNELKGLLKRVKVGYEKSLEAGLSPEKSLMMERYHVSKEMAKDPEAVARATRFVLTKFMVDKPIELIFLLVILSGVDSGLLKVLHEKQFSENSFFHLSRYAIWFHFVSSKIFLEFIAEFWLKLQKDARLGPIGGFDNIPTVEDFNKRFPLLQWFGKQLKRPDNSLWENYKYSGKVVWANVGAAFVTVSLLQLLTLERIDVDVFFAGLIFGYYISPLGGYYFKMENALEGSMNYALKDLIQAGNLDLNKEHKRLLSDPQVQSFKIQQAAKLRPKMNAYYSLLYDNFFNPEGLFVEMVINADTSFGPRGFQRLFTGGQTPTEHWIDFVNGLEKQNIIPESVADACKTIFTRKRTDLIIDL